MSRVAVLIAFISVYSVIAWAVDKKDDTPAAAATRKVLAGKIDVEFKDARLDDALQEIKALCVEKKLGKFAFRLDTGVSRNQNVSFQGKAKTVAEVLDGFFKKNGLGYVVISDTQNPYDGAVKIKQGKERGFAEGDEPAKTAKKDPPKAKAKAKDDPPETAKEKPADDPERAEKAAASKLSLIKELIRENVKKERIKERLGDLVRDFPKTKAAREAKEMLDKLGK